MLQINPALKNLNSANDLDHNHVSRVAMGFDLIQFRFVRPPRESLLAKLEAHCHSSGPILIPVRGRLGRMELVSATSRIRRSDMKRMWQVVAPDRIALQIIPDDWQTVRVELTRNYLADSESAALRMHMIRDGAFCIVGSGYEARSFNAPDGSRISYAGPYTVYCGECKLTGSPHCVREEKRVLGARDLERKKLRNAAELLAFDHLTDWTEEDKRCWREFDPVAMGRHVRKLELGLPRLPPRRPIHYMNGTRHRIPYDMDARLGWMTARWLMFGLHVGKDRRFHPDDQQSQHVLQAIANEFGAGPWLKKVPNPLLASSHPL